MYYPQTYHHIQEIQKYNIQDYRPRYNLSTLPIVLNNKLISYLGWSSFKRQSAKCGKSSACENNAAMPSRKQTSRKRAYCKLTIPHENVAATEKWRARGRNEDDLYVLYDVWVFYCIVSSRRGWNREMLAAKLCMVA